MLPEFDKQSIEKIAVLLAMLEKKVRRAQILSSRAEELLYDAATSLRDLQMTVRHPVVSALNAGVSTGPQLHDRFSRQNMQRAVSIVLARNDDGSAAVYINGGPRIDLPPSVAALLEILKADGGISGDSLVGWKSIGTIQSALKEHTKQNYSKTAIKQLIYRLRRLIESHGEGPLLVQGNRRLGYRFAVLRGLGTTIQHENK